MTRPQFEVADICQVAADPKHLVAEIGFLAVLTPVARTCNTTPRCIAW